MNIMLVLGTRPEAIKMAPVYHELQKHNDKIRTLVTLTAQHRQMMDQMLDIFNVKADYDLNVMTDNQTLSDITCSVIKGLENVLNRERIDFILVQGDTTTSFAAGLVGFYHKVSVGHVEAGLRTHLKYYPFPEEINRVLISCLSDAHFAPTEQAKQNLLKQGVQENTILVTGNTVIDALLSVANRKGLLNRPSNGKIKKILLTAHRRENFGRPIESVCKAILDIVELYEDVRVTFPVHLNPNVRQLVYKHLSNHSKIDLTEPLGYEDFVKHIAESHIILTDSGGLQEEAPSLGKPVLVLRNETERYEGVEAGTCILVGTDREKIVREVGNLLTKREDYLRMSKAVNPYGDGRASQRIARYFLNKIG